MSTPYTVKYGDTLTLIAQRHGFASWREIYYHQDNAAFRRKRPNPDKIFPGDVVMIPSTGPPPKPPPTPPPTEPAELSTQFALMQPGHPDDLMNDEGDYFFKIFDAVHPSVPQVYWLGAPGGYRHVRSKVTFGRESAKNRSKFQLDAPGRAITDLACHAFYVTRHKAGHRGPLSELFLGLLPHPVTIKVRRPLLSGSGSGKYNFQRNGQFQLVENPENWVTDAWGA